MASIDDNEGLTKLAVLFNRKHKTVAILLKYFKWYSIGAVQSAQYKVAFLLYHVTELGLSI